MSDIRTKPATPEYESTYERLKAAGEFGTKKEEVIAEIFVDGEKIAELIN